MGQSCGGRVLRCLTEKQDQLSSQACKDEVFYFEKMEVNDYRNDVILAEACRTDVDKHCKSVPKGAPAPTALRNVSSTIGSGFVGHGPCRAMPWPPCSDALICAGSCCGMEHCSTARPCLWPPEVQPWHPVA